MALDHALAQCVQPGAGAVRFYGWDPPTISLGRHQDARDAYDVAAVRAQGIQFVRRPTGGSAVLHDRELTYCAVVPVRALGGPRLAFGALCRGLVRGLAHLGVQADLVEGAGARARPTAAVPCFQGAVPGEITVGGRKLVGSAQARVGGAVLQHGSLLIGEDQSRLAGLIRRPAAPVGAPPTCLDDLLGSVPETAGLARALVAGLQEVCGGVWGEGGAGAREMEAAASLEARYRDPAWTWRR